MPSRLTNVQKGFLLLGILVLVVMTHLASDSSLSDQMSWKSTQTSKGPPYPRPSYLSQYQSLHNHSIVTLDTSQHPHWGAKDAQGQWGYVANLHAHWQVHPMPFQLESAEQEICQTPGQGTERMLGWRALQDHKYLQVLPPPTSSESPSRILCAIYTHAGQVNQTDAIRQTWGKRCDGLFFASTLTDEAHLHVHLPHQSQWEGKYRGIWQKVRAMFSYIYQHYLDEYDYVHFCGDDTFLIVENLRAFVTSPPVTNLTTHGKPFLAGFWTHWKDYKDKPNKQSFYYMGGGAGYTINVPALKLFVEQVSPACSKSENDGSEEDWYVTWCFKARGNLTGYDTRDALGAHRYHLLNLPQAVALTPQNKAGGAHYLIVKRSMQFMKEYHGFPLVWGFDYMSKDSIAFHNYKTPASMKRFERLLYGTGNELCQVKSDNE